MMRKSVDAGLLQVARGHDARESGAEDGDVDILRDRIARLTGGMWGSVS